MSKQYMFVVAILIMHIIAFCIVAYLLDVNLIYSLPAGVIAGMGAMFVNTSWGAK